VPRRLIIAALALMVVTCAATGLASAAAHKVFVERDVVGQELAYRPHAIGLSADGTFAIIGISYQSYGGPTATATAKAYVRGCTPNCAEGKEYRAPATLRLSGKIPCRGVTIYSRLHYALRGPLPSGFRRQGTEPLRPVGEKRC
jgi:hypothetical protein